MENIDLHKTAPGGRVFTYGERYALGEALKKYHGSDSETISMPKLFHDVMNIFHPGEDRAINADNVRYLTKILEGYSQWLEIEKKLTTIPTAEQKAAGYDNLVKKVGGFITVKALAEAHGKSVNDVLQWPYSTVFMLLFTAKEENDFIEKQRKLQKAKEKTGWRKR